MFPKPSSRDRGLLNDYACGCQVRRDDAGGYFIHACALHDAAPELLEACQTAFAELGRLYTGQELTDLEDNAAWQKLRAAIGQACGRRTGRRQAPACNRGRLPGDTGREN